MQFAAIDRASKADHNAVRALFIGLTKPSNLLSYSSGLVEQLEKEDTRHERVQG